MNSFRDSSESSPASPTPVVYSPHTNCSFSWMFGDRRSTVHRPSWEHQAQNYPHILLAPREQQGFKLQE